MKRFMGCAMVSVLFLGGVGACSKDKASDTTVAVTAAPADTAASDTAPGDTAAAGTDAATTDAASTEAVATDTAVASGGDAAVTSFCTQVDALTKKFKEVLADPSKGDVATLTADAQKLSATAATLAGSNAEQAKKVSDCAQKMAAALTPAA